MLRYLYTDDIQLNETNAPIILMISHQYGLHKLEKLCSGRLAETLSLESVCTILDRTHTLNNALTDRCLCYIQMHTDKLVDNVNGKEHMNIFNLGLEAFGKVMSMDLLSIDSEVVLFEKLMSWARAQCDARNIVPSSDQLRKMVKGRLEFIRFTAMSCDDFALSLRYVKPDFFLVEEAVSIFLHQHRCHIKTDIMFEDFPAYKYPREKYKRCVEYSFCKHSIVRKQNGTPIIMHRNMNRYKC